MKKRILSILSLLLVATNFLTAQETGVDTTDIGYRIGYKIGSYLPVTIILIVALLFIRKAYMFKEK